MSERIIELYQQAQKSVQFLSNSNEAKQKIVVGKFAQLIVQDAIGVVSKRYMGDNNREDMEVLRCVEDLTKHFGVE